MASTATSTAASQSSSSVILDWAHAQGVVAPDIDIQTSIVCANDALVVDNGVFTKSVSSGGHLYFGIPESLLITRKSVSKYLPTAHIAVLLSIPSVDMDASYEFENALILLFFLAESSKRKLSPWFPYFNAAPNVFHLTPNYTEDELLELHSTPLYKATLMRTEELLQTYNKLFPHLIVAYPDIFPEAWCTWEKFLWAVGMLDSRTFKIRIDGILQVVAIPLVDMLNHSFTNSLGNASFNHESRRVQLISTRNSNKGDELTITYGPHSNAELLLFYGFAINDNPYDTLELVMEAPEEDPAVSLLKMSLLASFGLATNLTFLLQKGAIPMQLLPSLRILLMDEVDLAEIALHPLVHVNNPISTVNEDCVLATFDVVLDSLQEQHHTTIQDDDILLQDETLPCRIRNVVIYRREQKKIIEWTKQWLAAQQ